MPLGGISKLLNSTIDDELLSATVIQITKTRPIFLLSFLLQEFGKKSLHNQNLLSDLVLIFFVAESSSMVTYFMNPSREVGESELGYVVHEIGRAHV